MTGSPVNTASGAYSLRASRSRSTVSVRGMGLSLSAAKTHTTAAVRRSALIV